MVRYNVKYNVNLPAELHKKFKLICVQEVRHMSEVIRSLIREYVAKAEKKKKT
jgi:metal-responsive CopG/Arc/MetJ family transcriptional regulator